MIVRRAGHEKTKEEKSTCAQITRHFRASEAGGYRLHRCETGQSCKSSTHTRAWHGPKTRCGDPGEAGRGISSGDMRTGARKPVSTADFHDSFGAVHGRARKRGNSDAVQEISR